MLKIASVLASNGGKPEKMKFVVQAESPTIAEAMVTSYLMQEEQWAEFTVPAIQHKRAEIIQNNETEGAKIWEAEITYTDENDKGKEQVIKQAFLFWATDALDAIDTVKEANDFEYRITGLNETAFADFILYVDYPVDKE